MSSRHEMLAALGVEELVERAPRPHALPPPALIYLLARADTPPEDKLLQNLLKACPEFVHESSEQKLPAGVKVLRLARGHHATLAEMIEDSSRKQGVWDAVLALRLGDD